MRILAIDPATKCGWAIGDERGVQAGGVFDVSIRRDESAGMRLIRLRSKLNALAESGPIDLLVYEAARNAGPRMQGALVCQAMLQGVIQLWAEDNKIEFKGLSPSEVKKHATGKGNAKKQQMIDAAKAKFGHVEDDNHADALWILDYAVKEYTGGELVGVAFQPVAGELPFPE